MKSIRSGARAPRAVGTAAAAAEPVSHEPKALAVAETPYVFSAQCEVRHLRAPIPTNR